MNEWVVGYLLKVKHWANRLFSIILRAPIDPFIAGQFAKLRLEINGKNVQRAYSYINPPKDKNLEFYLVSIPNGKLSICLHELKPGSSIMISKKAKGDFIIDKVPLFYRDLWMLATGTAIGPYLSILSQGDGLDRFKNIILVHAVRFFRDLNYLSKMRELQHFYGKKLHIVTITSREKIYGSLNGRIPDLIKNKKLELKVNLDIDPKFSHVMLCGNPQMVSDTIKVLKEVKNMERNFSTRSGNITVENYW